MCLGMGLISVCVCAHTYVSTIPVVYVMYIRVCVWMSGSVCTCHWEVLLRPGSFVKQMGCLGSNKLRAVLQGTSGANRSTTDRGRRTWRSESRPVRPSDVETVGEHPPVRPSVTCVSSDPTLDPDGTGGTRTDLTLDIPGEGSGARRGCRWVVGVRVG